MMRFIKILPLLATAVTLIQKPEFKSSLFQKQLKAECTKICGKTACTYISYLGWAVVNSEKQIAFSKLTCPSPAEKEKKYSLFYYINRIAGKGRRLKTYNVVLKNIGFKRYLSKHKFKKHKQACVLVNDLFTRCYLPHNRELYLSLEYNRKTTLKVRLRVGDKQKEIAKEEFDEIYILARFAVYLSSDGKYAIIVMHFYTGYRVDGYIRVYKVTGW